MSPAPLLAYSSSGGSSSSNDFFTGVKDGSNLRRSSSQTSISGFQTNVYGNVWKVRHHSPVSLPGARFSKTTLI